MATEGKGPIVIPCYLVGGVPYVLEVDANGKLAVRAAEIETLLAGGLPAALDSGALKVKEQSPISGFATSAKQDTMITALQLIDDLRAALGSVNTDDLQVDVKTMPTVTVQAAGGDKPLSLESVIGEVLQNLNLPAGSYHLTGAPVPTGKLWIITLASAWVLTSTIPRLRIRAIHNSLEYNLLWASPPTTITLYPWNGQIALDAGDYMEAYVEGAAAGNYLLFHYLGYQMDAP